MLTLTIIYNEILYRPLLNALVYLYNIIPGHDLGIAIIILTIIIRFILYPLSQSSIRSQKVLQSVAPEIKKIQKKYRKDKTKQMQVLMDFYKKNKINPAAGCLPLLIQLPVLIALYQVFFTGLNSAALENLYPFIVPATEHINSMFLGVIDLAKGHNIFLALAAGIFQFIQVKMIMPKTDSLGSIFAKVKREREKDFSETMQDASQIMSKQMLYLSPIMTILIAYSFPSGLALYWIVTTLFTIGQQYLIGPKTILVSKTK